MRTLFTAIVLSRRVRLCLLVLLASWALLPQAAQAAVSVTVSPSSASLCVGESQTFTASASPSGCEGTPGTPTYQWSIDGGAFSAADPSPYYTYTASGSPGNHTLTCKATVSGCGDGTGSATITIKAAGITMNSASASPPQPTTCDLVYFTASASLNCGSGPIDYSWTFGDGGTSTMQSPTHQYGVPGNKTVTVTATSGPYVAQRQWILTVTQGPPPGITIDSASGSNPATVCNAVQFTASAHENCGNGNITYTWNFGDQTPLVQGQSVAHQYHSANPNPGFLVTVTASDNTNSQSQSFYQPVTQPTFTVTAGASSNPALVCNQVQFSATPSGGCGGTVNYVWNFGDGTPTVTGSSPLHQFPGAGVYNVTVTATSGPLTASATITMTVNSDTPGVPGNVRVTAVTAYSVSLAWDAASGAQSYKVYRSTNGGAYAQVGSASGLTYIDASCQQSTNYCYKVSAVGMCGTEGPLSTPPACTTTLCDPVITIQSATATPNPQFAGKPVNFSASATDSCPATLSYTWDFGDNKPTASGQNVTHIYDGAKKDANDNVIPYTVTLTVSDNTVTKTRTLNVTIDDGSGHLGRPKGPNDGNQCDCETGIDPETGLAHSTTEDPVRTRGYPLQYDVVVSTRSDETNRPLGNARFTYDIHAGAQLLCQSNGDVASHWLLVDGDGHNLDFGPTSGPPAATSGIYSQFQVLYSGQTVIGYQLLNAGSPREMASRGNFTYTFNSLGQLTQLKDPAGNPQTLSYDASNKLAQILDVNTQKSITFQYNGALVSQIRQNNSQAIMALGYTNGSLTSIAAQDSLNNTRYSKNYIYNSDGSLLNITHDQDPATKIQYTYISYPGLCGPPKLMTSSSGSGGSGGGNVFYAQMTWGRPKAAGAADSVYSTNAKGGVTRYDYDTQGHLFRIVSPTYAGATNPLTATMAYNANGQVTSYADNNTSSTTGYTGYGLVSSYTDALSHSWIWNYNGVDLTSASDPVSQNTIAYADPLQPHIPTSTTDASGNIWSFEPNSYGQIKKVTPPTGSPTAPSTVVYDEIANSATLGYPLSETDGNGDPVTFDAYDSLGDLLQVSTYPVHGNTTVKNTTQFEYDAAQRVTKVTRPDNKTFQSFYSGRNLDHTVDEAGTQFNYTYCPTCGALAGTTGPLGWSLAWAYDADHNLASFTDARSNTTQYAYGLADELTQITYPDNSTIGYLYNDGGLVRQVTNGRGRQMTFAYDGAERLHQVTFPTSAQASILYNYNSDNTPQNFVDGMGTTAYDYFLNGWLKTVTYNYGTGGLTNVQKLEYDYFPDGSRKTLKWTNGTTIVGTWTYGYDAAGNLTSLLNPWSETTGWTYDGEGKMTGQTNHNGTSVAYGYNQATGWPTSITQNGPSGLLASYVLTYDLGANTIGNLTGVAENGGSSVTFGYDALYRLTAESRTSGGSTTSHSYGYDLAGNLNANDGYTFSYDTANKLSSSTDQYASYSHDGDGNLTHGFQSGNYYYGGYSVTYDDLSHATQISGQSYTNNYGYDARGLRVRSERGGLTTFYVFDGTTLLGEVDGTDNQVKAAYTWGADGLVSEHLVSTGYQGGGTAKSLWYQFGPQGETRQLTDSTGAVADTYSYTAYGRQVSSAGSDANPFRYGGQWGYYTGPSGASTLILCGLRWYDPAMGRFISRDPIAYDGGENLYAYCEQNPVNLTDPSGLQALTNDHHNFPKAYGGDPNQPLTTMPRDEHVQLHRDMQEFMKGKTNANGDNMQWRSNNSGQRIRENFSPREIENALGDFYRRNRTRYPDAARGFFQQCPAQARSRSAKKVGGRLARRILKCAAKKVPIMNVGFFLYDWNDGGFVHAVNEATWPVSVLWHGK